MTRRAPAAKADRERARRAAAYADELYENVEGDRARTERLNLWMQGLATTEQAIARTHALHDAHDAAQVAADAFEETHQERKAASYRARARRIRNMFSVWRRPSRDPSDRRPRRISDRPRSAEGNENLAYLLDRDVRAIGPERAAAPPAPDIRLLISPSGSYRYVGLENGRPVSALQIMSRDGGIRGVILNVYTTPFARRRGWAARLLEVARRRFREVKHSDDLSPAGEAWKSVVRDPESARRRRALSLHEDASRANRRLNAERHRYLDKPLAKNPARWHARVATLAREASDLWAVTADAYEEAGDVNMGELARRKSHALDVLVIDYTAGIARDARTRLRRARED